MADPILAYITPIERNQVGGGPIVPPNEIDNTLPIPEPPPGVWPPPSVSHPIVPAPPGTPPGTIWPTPGRPPRPDNTLPGQPPRPDNTLPSSLHWMLCYSPNLGWKFVCVDPSLKPTHPIAPGGSIPHPDQGLPGSQPHPDQGLPGQSPARPDNSLPPTAQPKR